MTRSNSPVLTYLGRRLLHFVLSVFVLVTAAFLLMRLIPGDPALLSAGPTAPPALVERRRIELGLDRPLWVQYLTFWKGLFTGDLGYSISSRTSPCPRFTVSRRSSPARRSLTSACSETAR